MPWNRDEMAARAARISAATLNERLPVGNSHDELGRLATVINDLLGRVDVAFRNANAICRRRVARGAHANRHRAWCGRCHFATARSRRVRVSRSARGHSR